MSNTKYWDQLRTPPQGALKKIQYGNLKGKSDINPQWRMQAMTEVFGPCGVGWKYEKVKEWTYAGIDTHTVAAFVDVNIYILNGKEWSEPIPGTGGSMLVIKDKNGIHLNDEAFKMATTDALSVAMKQVGVAADIYMGIMDGSKYQTPRNVTTPSTTIHDDAWALYEAKKATLTAEQANWVQDELNKGNAQDVIDALKKV